MKKAEKAMTLKELIPMYGETKQQVDELDKVAKSQNKKIKEQMVKLLKNDANTVDQEVDGWIATYQQRVSESYNQEALLEYVKKSKLLKDCVETKEVVNEQKLEDLLYSKKVSKKVLLELDAFRTKKTTEYLYIKRKEE